VAQREGALDGLVTMLAMRAFEDVRRLLCIGAHSDDIEIGCAGTVLRLLAARPDIEVHWVVLSADEERREEAEKSARSLLGDAARSDVQVMQFEERFFPYHGEEIKRFFDGLGRTVQPDLILTHCRDDVHQDHRLVAELTWNTFRDHLILEYEIVKWEGDLGHPNVFVPLDRETCERKVAAILDGFPSQQRRYWFTDETFWALLRLRGVEARSPSGYAEGFHSRKAVLGA
jgi:LmbE family N-acetylglucosaminyl deacetylase